MIYTIGYIRHVKRRTKMINNIKPTIALIKQQGPGKNGINLFNSLLYPLGPSLTVTTVLEKTNLFKFSDAFYLVLLIIIIIVSFIIFIHKNVNLLTKSFQLQDDYKITIRVEDYLNNAKYFKESTCITAINDQFDLKNTRTESLQS